MKRLEDAAYIVLFENMEPKRQKTLSNHSQLATLGVTKATVPGIEDPGLRRFAAYILDVEGNAGSLDGVKASYAKYCQIKAVITGGYFYEHYNARGPNVYLLTKDSATGPDSHPLKNSKFIYRYENGDGVIEKELGKEDFFKMVENNKYIHRTVLGGPNIHLSPESIDYKVGCVSMRQLLGSQDWQKLISSL